MMTTEEYNDKPTGSNDRGCPKMTDLIPRDAAIMAIIKQIGEGTEQWVQGNNSAIYACCASLRAIPSIDPAAIREAALKEAAHVALNMNNGETAKAIHRAILALIGEKK